MLFSNGILCNLLSNLFTGLGACNDAYAGLHHCKPGLILYTQSTQEWDIHDLVFLHGAALLCLLVLLWDGAGA